MATLSTEAVAARVQELMPLARTNPAAYRRRMWGWVLLGYAFVALLLLGALGLLGGLVWVAVVVGVGGLVVKLLLIPVFFMWKILRSLWVTFDPPQGRELTPAEAAPLFELLAQQTHALRAPAVHRVLLTDDFNAAVQQLPRLGMLGWPRNYLLLGLPLLQALSPEQAAAVVAHELGHLRGGHGRFGAWVYRVNASWQQLIARMSGTASGGLVRRFTDWYVPRFNAWSHPLRRTDEFAADAAAARLTSPAALASALCAIVVREPALDQQYWKPLLAGIADMPSVPTHTLSNLLPTARAAELPAAEADALLRRAVDEDADPFSTHPALGERLTALGEAAGRPPVPAATAAEAWLGTGLPALAAELDAAWAAANAAAWHERHQLLCEQRQTLAALQARQATGEVLVPDDAWTLADLTEDHVGAAEALPLFRALVHDSQHGPSAQFSVGRILLGQDDATGLPLLEEVMLQAPAFTSAGLALQQAYYQRQGDRQAARQLLTRQYRQADVEEAAEAERQGFAQDDVALPHELSPKDLAPIVAMLQEPANCVAQAWILRKQLTLFAAERPFFVLLLRAVQTAELRSDEQQSAWATELAGRIRVPGEGLVVPLLNEFTWLLRRAQQTPGTEVYNQKTAK